MRVAYPPREVESTAPGLHLGAGSDALPGWINLDRVGSAGIDVVHDLDAPWLPFADDSMGRIRATFVIEHLREPVRMLEEIYRVGRDGALVEIAVPYWNSVCVARDITHRRGFHENNFMVLDPRLKRWKPFYPRCRYRLLHLGVLVLERHRPVWRPRAVRALLAAARWVPNVVRDLAVVLRVDKSSSWSPESHTWT